MYVTIVTETPVKAAIASVIGNVVLVLQLLVSSHAFSNVRVISGITVVSSTASISC
jgi:hypothetical protein